MRFGRAIGSAGWSVAGSVSAPAIWGKVPSHADYVAHGVKADEVAALQQWLAAQVRAPTAPPRAARPPRDPRAPVDRWLALEPERYRPSPHSIPVAFVLPPGALAFSGPQHVMGVVANSCDKLGRQHPLIVYQRANTRWLRQHFMSLADDGASAHEGVHHGATGDPLADLREPWLFWLARLVSRYARHPDAAAWLDEGDDAASPDSAVSTPGRAAIGVAGVATAAVASTALGAAPLSLGEAIAAFWALHAPGWSQYIGVVQRAPSAAALQAVLERAGSVTEHDAADDLRGVAYAPWADWPDRMWSAKPVPAFWQQDSYGGYVGASQRLGELWGR